MDDQAIENKLCAARARLILDKPFLGALVLRLPLVAASPKWCRTTATDARAFYYNPDYIAALRPQEAQFVLAHEALHCALSHFARRGHRHKHRWDIACDYAVSPILLKEGLTPPPGTLYEEKFEGLTAEEIYPCLDDRTDAQDTLDQHVYDADDPDEGTRNEGQDDHTDSPSWPPQGAQDPQPGHSPAQSSAGTAESPSAGSPSAGPGSPRSVPRPVPLTAQARETLAIQWQQRLAGAAQQALQAGKLGGALARLVDGLLQPRLPWRMLLSRYLSLTARDDYSYTRPSTRRGDPAIYPSLRSGELNLMVVLDVSGSITDQEMAEFIAEVDALKGYLRARITLHACDAALAEDGPWVFEPWIDFAVPRTFRGGGGTDFRPVFNWVDRQDRQPDLLLYFTDAQGPFPLGPPAYPVLWLIKGKAPVPWGQRIQLN